MFQNMLAETTREYPDFAHILNEPSQRSDALACSLQMYECIFGPLWCRQPLGTYTIVWASDVLVRISAGLLGDVPEAVRERAKQQAEDVRRVLTEGERTILCIHDPHVLPLLETHVLRSARCRDLRLTLAGHFHTPWMRWGLPVRVRRDYRLVVCPSLTGNRLAGGGGLLLGDRDGKLCVLRYFLEDDQLRRIFGGA